MLSEKTIVVTIGNYGAVVALHEGNAIKNKIFIEELNEDTKKQLAEVFNANKAASTYVLLDTVDQSYKKKIYPSVRRGDLSRIIKRDMAADGDKEGIKNYIILNNKKKGKKQVSNSRWECLFISSSNSDIINKWVEFLLDMPNHMIGIYMLPVEAYGLFKLIKDNLKTHSKIQNKNNDLYCFLIQNKVSGIRQIVFSDQGIVFTRVVNYNFEQEDFLEKYEQDIYSTFEYLKRLFPDLSMAELDIVNIFPSEVLEKLKKMSNIELNFINYTPSKMATEIGYPKLIPQNSQFCDLLISKVFAKSKKILKFTTPKIVFLEKFFIALKSSYYFNLILVMAICSTALFTVLSQEKIADLIDIAETEKFSAIQELARIKKTATEGAQISEENEEVEVERITDFGKVEEVLGPMAKDFSRLYVNLKFLKDFDIKLNKFSYSVQNFSSKSPSPNNSYSIGFGGEIINKSGDIEDLFKEFDTLVIEVKKNMEKGDVKYTELPRNIDFNKKYYNFPIDFTVSNRN